MKPTCELESLRSTDCISPELREEYNDILSQYTKKRYMAFYGNWRNKKASRIALVQTAVSDNTLTIEDLMKALMDLYMQDVISEASNYVLFEAVHGGGLREVIKNILYDLYQKLRDKSVADKFIPPKLQELHAQARRHWVSSGVSFTFLIEACGPISLDGFHKANCRSPKNR